MATSFSVETSVVMGGGVAGTSISPPPSGSFTLGTAPQKKEDPPPHFSLGCCTSGGVEPQAVVFSLGFGKGGGGASGGVSVW